LYLLLPVVILGIGAFLRLWQVNALGYNSDEAVYAGQAAAMAADPVLKEIFPIFRAHPLLFQFVLALTFSFGVNDLTGRLVSVVVGLTTICLVYWLGTLLYGRRAGLLAMLFMALMPYHVIVSRQVLLDGPMTLCATLTLYLVARFATTRRPIWLYAAGAGMGLTFLSKETGIILLGAIYAFLALSPEIRVRLRDLVGSIVSMLLVIAPFPISLALAGGEGTQKAQSYLIWQLFRRPNHTWDFYLTTVPDAMGLLLIVAALAGLWLLRHERSWRERLLLWWIIVPTVFFQLWPTKGFHYLLITAPALAVLAARTLSRWWPAWAQERGRRGSSMIWLPVALTSIIALTLLLPSWQGIQSSSSTLFLAGSGGVSGGRETGLWIDANVPKGAKLMTLGPSMANILQFYGHRKAYGLSVSPNPLHRNPSYEPIRNPDLQIRSGDLQYIVWDSFSAARSPFFSEKMLEYVRRYHGRVVHSESVKVMTPAGEPTLKPVIVVYEVRP
jgi:4-amino-4-deoxy-L-arabinose transferase-like glycosyltransferase